ncbi:hypothetical protein [Sphingomonas abaci]|uniref:Uncharacterized protein n=1 Tax=Sphingomonas abaci TaxID=237611 RepID=A0A7W7EXR7_9SPHN|nr:hypothetical protein [Sphingomonas abaci]MBB4617371.1 hypothetical protein [Sphingomonas abaci]
MSTAETTPDRTRPARHRWRRVLLVLSALLLGSVLLLTGGTPIGRTFPAPTAEQVGAARAAAMQLRILRATPGASGSVRFSEADLRAISTLASHGFAPDRLDARLADGALRIDAAHALPLGRWLNVAMTIRSQPKGFPPIRMTIGHVPLGERPTRLLIRLARWVLAKRDVPIPPLDTLVRGFSVLQNGVAADVTLSPAMLEGLARLDGHRIDPAQVARIYCTLGRLQANAPLADVAAQVRRAFTLQPPATATAGRNRATFVALAMFLVDPRAGEMAGDARERTDACRVAVPVVTLHGRADLTMHWTLSAAMTAGAGTQIAQAMGTWKELADSLSKQSEFAIGDPTGFSFLDLSADRSGFRVATAAVRPDDAVRLATMLSKVTEDQILPPSLMTQQDGLTNQQFVRHYGGIADPRYDAAVARIDRVLEVEGIN